MNRRHAKLRDWAIDDLNPDGWSQRLRPQQLALDLPWRPFLASLNGAPTYR